MVERVCTVYGVKNTNDSRKGSTMKKTISLVLSLVIAGLAQAGIITVGPNVGNDFETIQAGIDAANDGDIVLVAPGEYITTEPITFRGKAITVQSEVGPDQTTIRMGTPTDPDRASVVILENNETADSVLDGFTITGGKGSWAFIPTKAWTGGYGCVGGGIFFKASSGTLRNCAIVQNIAKHGGGVFCFLSCTPRLIDCTIAENSAQLGIGGGVYLWGEASLTINDCIIRDNSAIGTTKYVNGYGGGGVGQENSLLTLNNCKIMGNSAGVGCGGVGCLNNSSMILTNSIITENSASIVGGGTGGWYGSFTVTDCVIRSNRAQDVGGGIYCGHSSATITNCVIAQNTTADREGGGGVMCSYPDASLTIRNCTIYGNSTENRSWGGGGVLCRNASVTVTNSIIWGNTAPKGREISVQDAASTLAITYSSVADGEAGISVGGGCTLNWGAGNIDADPCFAYPSNDDFHLKSEAGCWDPNSQTWVQDNVTSPCIDAGDPLSPIGWELFPNGGFVNMGAYGGTPKASKTYFGEPPCETIVAGDINGDGQVNRADLEIMALHWTDDEPLPLP